MNTFDPETLASFCASLTAHVWAGKRYPTKIHALPSPRKGQTTRYLIVFKHTKILLEAGVRMALVDDRFAADVLKGQQTNAFAKQLKTHVLAANRPFQAAVPAPGYDRAVYLLFYDRAVRLDLFGRGEIYLFLQDGPTFRWSDMRGGKKSGDVVSPWSLNVPVVAKPVVAADFWARNEALLANCRTTTGAKPVKKKRSAKDHVAQQVRQLERKIDQVTAQATAALEQQDHARANELFAKVKKMKQKVVRARDHVAKAPDVRPAKAAPAPKTVELVTKYRLGPNADVAVVGRSAAENVQLVRKAKQRQQPGTLFFHADAHGAAAVVVTPTGSQVHPSALEKAADLAAAYCREWTSPVAPACAVHSVPIDRAELAAPSGQTMPTGSVMLRGTRTKYARRPCERWVGVALEGTVYRVSVGPLSVLQSCSTFTWKIPGSKSKGKLVGLVRSLKRMMSKGDAVKVLELVQTQL